MLRPLVALCAILFLRCAAPAAPAPPPADASPAPAAEAPAPPAPSPPAPTAEASCNTDSDCPGGQVCDGCGGPRSCVHGCHQNSQCPGGHQCRQVQCIRCPCPGQCDS